MKRIMKKIIYLIISIITVVCCLSGCEPKETLEIHIGYQSVTAQTWGALIIKNQEIFEQKLKDIYPDKDIKVVWHDDISGAIINNNMIAGKYQVGYMGDMPCLINGYNSNVKDEYNSKCIAIDGRGKKGVNQDVLVPINSEVENIQDLVGKTISTPIGSSAHRMLLRVLQNNKIVDKVTIVHHDINLANTLLMKGEVDAFSVWAPYGNYLVNANVAKKLVDGSESGEDYLTGIIVNEDWAKQNPRIYEALVESIKESHEYICTSPEEAAHIFQEESDFPFEVCLDMANNIEWDDVIYEEDIETFKQGLAFLNELNIIEEYDCTLFFDYKN